MLDVRSLCRLHVGPVTFSMADGECISLMGASGSGKSILLRMVADLDPHDGDALLDGVSCSQIPAPVWRSRVAYVPAEAGWWADDVASHFTPDFPADMLRQARLPSDALSWPVDRLSTGERQRLSILRALRPPTRALLLDEPTSGLDSDSVAAMERILRDLLARGMSILIVTHDASQAARLASRRFILGHGRMDVEAA